MRARAEEEPETKVHTGPFGPQAVLPMEPNRLGLVLVLFNLVSPMALNCFLCLGKASLGF